MAMEKEATWARFSASAKWSFKVLEFVWIFSSMSELE
jgi:hypothetical protein